MAEVFVSYARADEPQATRVAESLREAGYSVWRDDELPAHRAYADVIQERLKSAQAVVVLWSAEAARSQWVRSEADAARQFGTLVQARIDGTIPPMPFDQIQCADLSRWSGDANAAGWRRLVASVAALAGSGQGGAAKNKRRAVRELSVCVLPFANMSGDAEQEYFSDGISEDITTDLSKVSALEVIARNTAFQFKGQSLDVCDIATKLGVSHLLEGSVRKAGGRVRITAQLIDGRTGGHIWADRYDRDLTDIFAIQDEISKAIVDALKVKLLPDEKQAIEQRGTGSAEAYNLYLMARQYWITGNQGDRRREERVIRICRRAVEIDPRYAKAWGLMAIAQANLRFSFDLSGDDGRAAAERSLEFDPNIPEAYCALGRILVEDGRFAEAEIHIWRALELDANSWEANRDAARLCYTQCRFEEAAQHWERAVAQFDSDFHSWGMLCSCYEALGDRALLLRAAQKTLEQCEHVVKEDPSNGTALSLGADALAILGDKQRAREWVDQALLVDPDNDLTRFNLACITALHLDDPDFALDLLEPVILRMTRSRFNTGFNDPDLESLRDHPRFKRMVEEAKKSGTTSQPTRAAEASLPLRS